jgi:hypothetical protein
MYKFHECKRREKLLIYRHPLCTNQLPSALEFIFVVIQITTTETSPAQNVAAYQAQCVTYILYNFKKLTTIGKALL